MARNRTYDHRLKTLIYETKNPNLFPMLRIPRSTALGWIRNGLNQVVSHESLDYSRDDLISKISSLEIELAKEKSKQELSTFTFKLFGLHIQYVQTSFCKNQRIITQCNSESWKSSFIKRMLNLNWAKQCKVPCLEETI